MVIGKGKIHL